MSKQIKLTKHQKEKISEVLDNLEKHDIALLSGVAGTGKTTSVKSIIHSFMSKDPYCEVVVTATTHKAVAVISESIENIPVMTIHSFLHMVPDKKSEVMRMVVSKSRKPNYADLLVIEEFSMLTKDVIDALNDHIDEYGTKVLFVGDASQLILEEDSMKSFNLDKYTSVLTEPMRQKALSDLAMYSNMASNYILGLGEEPSVPYGNDIVKYTSHKEFIKAWKQCHSKDKAIIAFHNKTVKAYNSNIAKKFKMQDEEYVAGNTVSLRSAVSTAEQRIIPNRAIVKLEEVKDEKDYYQVKSNRGTFRINKTATWLKELLQKYVDTLDWNKYYKIKEMYTQVHHSDALTVHASQGSTYDQVFIDASDIIDAPRDHNRLAYVAISRARYMAHIYVGDKRDYSAFKLELDDVI